MEFESGWGSGMNMEPSSLDLSWEVSELSVRDRSRTTWVCLFGLSTFLHLIVATAILMFGTFALDMPGAPGPLGGVMQVGLYGALPGDQEGGDGQAAGAGASAEQEIADIEPAEPLDLEPDISEQLDLESAAPEAPEPQPLETPTTKPDLEAISLNQTPPEPKKQKEPKPKERPRKEVRTKIPAKETVVSNAVSWRSETQGSGRAQSGKGSGQGLGANDAKPGGEGGGGEGGGGGGSQAGLLKSYIDANYKYIIRLIRRKMVYPEEAKKQGITGTATVAFTIGGNGQVAQVRINRSSGNQLLDQAALSAVQRAAPFPPPPASANIAIPLVFGLR